MDQSKILDRMRRLCSMREYCSTDIRRKIIDDLRRDAAAGDARIDSAAEDLLKTLIKEGYIDDRRFANAFARDKSAIGGWGSRKIRNALILKGIDPDLIAQALDGIDSGKANAKLKKSLILKAKSLGSKPDARQRLLRFAAGRGYSYEETISVLNVILTEKNNITK